MHQRTVSGVALALLGLVIALFQALANEYYLYWEWWWADILMHFLGGAFIAGGVLWFIRFEVPIGLRPRVPVFLATLVATLLVGVAWEVFEYVTDSASAINYTLDTSLDIAMDVVGMLAAYLIMKRYVF